MKMRKLLFGVVLAAGCAGEAAVPATPTWADDVQPILQGNCFHCHGGGPFPKDWVTMPSPIGPTRFDVYDINDPKYADLGFGPYTSQDLFKAAKDSGNFALVTGFAGMKGDARMPPPPAAPLSDRDVSVLRKWMTTGFTQGKHDPNHKPAVAWLDRPRSIVVSDEDGDQVLGRADCGGTKIQLPYTGAHAPKGGFQAPCTVEVYDGFESATYTLK